MDFYEINGQPLFGEYTFTPGSGLEVFEPYSYNIEFGRRWREAVETRRSAGRADGKAIIAI